MQRPCLREHLGTVPPDGEQKQQGWNFPPGEDRSAGSNGVSEAAWLGGAGSAGADFSQPVSLMVRFGSWLRRLGTPRKTKRGSLLASLESLPSERRGSPSPAMPQRAFRPAAVIRWMPIGTVIATGVAMAAVVVGAFGGLWPSPCAAAGPATEPSGFFQPGFAQSVLQQTFWLRSPLEVAKEDNHLQKAERAMQTIGAGPGSRSIRVCSDLEVDPWDRQAACQAAEQNAQHQLYEELSRWAEQLTGQKLSARRLVAEHAWLLAQPGVQQTQQMQVKEKPDSWVAQQEITISVPAPVLARWVERLHAQKHQRTVWISGAAAGTLLGWLMGLWLMVRWDRATGGYYRAGVVLGSLLVLGTLTGLGWWLLWVNLY